MEGYNGSSTGCESPSSLYPAFWMPLIHVARGAQFTSSTRKSSTGLRWMLAVPPGLQISNESIRDIDAASFEPFCISYFQCLTRLHLQLFHAQSPESTNITIPTSPPLLYHLTDTNKAQNRQTLHINPRWKCLSQI